MKLKFNFNIFEMSIFIHSLKKYLKKSFNYKNYNPEKLTPINLIWNILQIVKFEERKFRGTGLYI